MAILVAACMTFLLGLAALAVDLGMARNQRLGLQNAADSGALAGSFDLADADVARRVAAEYAFSSVGLATPAPTSCGTDTECFVDPDYRVVVTAPYSNGNFGLPPDELIHVTMCGEAPSAFGRILGATSMPVCGEAVAAGGPGASACALCILDPSGTALRGSGGGMLEVTNGSILVNSGDSKAVSVSGGSSISTDQVFGVNGGYKAPAGALTPTPTAHAPVADPLAALAVPALAGSPAPKVSVSGSADATLLPGIYSKIQSSSSGQLTLQPGVYVVTEEIKLSGTPASGKVSLFAHGVTIYFACKDYPDPCKAGQSGAALSMSGGSSLSWSPPGSGPYEGVSIFSDRNNSGTFKLTGSSGASFSGSIYARSGGLSFTGSSAMAMRSMIVVGSLEMTGSANVDVVYDPEDNSPVAAGSGDRRLVG